MEIRTQSYCSILSTVSNENKEMKSHPLIMEQTFIQNLLEVSNGINVERKHAFLNDFHDSLKEILTCVGCGGIQHENSLAFSCGHRYCEICSKNLSFCSKCETERRQRGFIIDQDHSDLLAIIERLKTNFNVDRTFFEMLKFFLTAPHWLKQEDLAIVIHNTIKNSPEVSQEYDKSPKKFTASSKHFKTLVDKTHNFKKKLIFSTNVSVVQPQISKNDSESLFMDSNRKTVPFDNTLEVENSNSYLNLQLPANEFRNPIVAESPGGHHKRSKRKLSKNYMTDATTDKRCPKTRRIGNKPEVAVSSNEHSNSPFRLTKKHVSDENSSSSSPFLSSTADALSKNAEGCTDSLEKVKMATRSSRSNSLNCEEECAKSIENSVHPVEMQMQKSQKSNSSSRIEIDIVDDKRGLAHVHQRMSKSANSVLSLPDPEMEEAIDINLWQRDENMLRKKKSLMFKSVKERNRQRLFFDESAKLHSTDDHVNVVQLGMHVPVMQSKASNSSQIDDLKQSLPEKISAEEKGDITLASELNAYCQVSDSKQEVGSSKMMSGLKVRSSSNWITETNDEWSLFGESSISQTCPSKLDVNSLEMGNDEHKIQVSRMPVSKSEPNITVKSCPVPSITKSTKKIFPPKFDDHSKLKVGPDLSSKSQTYSSISTEASFKTSEFIPSTKTNATVNFKSLPIDIMRTKSIASIGSVPAVDRKIHTDHTFPSNFPQSPVTTYESSSCSVELIEKSSQETVATISDTVTNDDENHIRKTATSIPSQPITIFSSSSKNNVSTANNKTDQTARNVKSDETVEMHVASSGRFESDDSFVNVAETKCIKLKNAINCRNHSIHFPENLTESSKNFTVDAVNCSDCEKSVLFSTKNSGLAEDLLTIPTSPRSKSVSCQTTSDLHISLLEQEFPHLFIQRRSGVSMYGTPYKSTPTDSEARDNLKTPQISGISRPISFTAISSVTSSEKKIIENLFTDRSVLDDSSFHCASIAEKMLDKSIQPLPSTGKKVFSASTTFTSEKPYPIERLTFELDSDVDLEKQKIMNNSLYTASSTPRSRSEAFYCSNVDTISQRGKMDGSILKRGTNESNKAEFVDSGRQNDIFSSTATEKISGQQNSENRPNNDNVDIVSDQNVILNDSCVVRCSRQISSEAVANHLDQNLKISRNAASANNHAAEDETALVPDNFDVDGEDDDDDVEFIAGTPTSSRRCVDDNLEKLMTQSFSLKNKFCEDVSKGDQIDQIFLDDASSKNQKSPPTSRSFINYSRPLLPSLPMPDLPASEMSDIVQKPSLDLFNSTAASSVQTSSSLALVITGLKDADVKLVKLFCQHFSVSLLDQITSGTTHLVVKTDLKSRTARTFKYLQAIVNSICVISIEWVQACIDTNETLNEEKFIPLDSSGECGPLRAYKSRRGVIPSPLSWLRDYCLFFMEPVPSACTLIQLQEIVEKTGAVVITDLKYFKKYATLHHLIIISDEEGSSQTSNTDIANWLQTYQAVAIEFNWLLEVIGRNRVVPFADYELVEIPPNLLLKLNFPNEMLQYEREDVDDSD